MRRRAIIWKRVSSCIAITVSMGALAPVSAQQAQDEAQMRQIMEQAQKMQACMAEVDQKALENLRVEGEAMGEKVSALCAAGKRDKALSAIIAYSKKIANSPGLKEIRECSESLGGIKFGVSPPMLEDIEKSGHVCDER